MTGFFPFKMQHLITRGSRQRLLQLLSLLLLLQGVFPVQLHTLLTKNDQGTLVQVCTLEGALTIELDKNGNPVHDTIKENHRTAAIAFSQLMAAALPGATIPVLHQPDLPYLPPAGINHASTPGIFPGLLPIRAPPA